jgi:hypothetical protein
MARIRQQIHDNLVALISLTIAVAALGYNTWRNETTEEQRNIRHAAFRVLENLGELQEVVDDRYYYLSFEELRDREGALRLRGFGGAAMIRDLMNLMPPPGPAAGEELHQLWLENFNVLTELGAGGQHSAAAQQAEKELTQAIGDTRAAVLMVLKSLE